MGRCPASHLFFLYRFDLKEIPFKQGFFCFDVTNVVTNAPAMPRDDQYLPDRDGRLFARLVVPKDLHSVVGKSKLRAPLWPDRRAAIQLRSGAVAQLQHQIRASQAAGDPDEPCKRTGPLAPDWIALSHDHRRMASDDELRNDIRPSFGFVDEALVHQRCSGSPAPSGSPHGTHALIPLA